MIEAGERGLDRRGGLRAGRAVDEDDGQAEVAGGGDLAIGGVAAAVLRHDDLDAAGGEQSALVGFGEGAAGEEGLGAGWQVGRRDGFDAADEVVVVRGGAEGGDLLTADGEEHPAGCVAEGRGGGGHVGDAGPAVAGDRLPRRALEDDEGDGDGGGSAHGVAGDPAGERVRGVDEDRDGVGAEPVGEAVRAAEAADADADAGGGVGDLRRAGATGEGEGDAEPRAPGQTAGKLAGLAGAAEDEDMHGSASSDVPAATANPKWLAVVGIGEDGLAGLGARARRLIGAAEVVFGGRRHLTLAAALVSGEARAWPSPFDAAMAEVLALRGRRVCVLASGDPIQHGVGATLARRLDAHEMEVVPAPSAFSLAAARLGWALHETETISLHGRAIEAIRPLLHPGSRILALTSDGSSPALLARLLVADGFGASRLCVLEALGGPHERLRDGIAARFADTACGALNVVAVEVVAAPGARVLPLGTLDDTLFENDGQLTKREVRAVTLAALAPRRGELLWDIGAGAGSVGIEWMLRHPSLRAVAIEADAARAARIRRNAAALGTPGLTVVEGAAPAALAGLPAPSAIFLGGGGADPGVLDAALAALPPGGRMVANAVTLEMQALLAATAARLGGTLTTISIARAAPVGGMTGWRPAMPVVQWGWTKP